MKPNLCVCLLAPMLAACPTTPVRQALDKDAIAKVQAEIKQEVGMYLAATATPDKIALGQPSDFWCGRGNIDFDVSSVKAQLTTTVETTKNAGIKAKIPFKAIEVDPSGSVKTDVTNTQELDYTLWPLASDQQPSFPIPTPEDLDKAPIAKALLALREALINSARKTSPGPQACFTDYNPAKPSDDPGNSFKLGLSFVNDVTGGFELTVWVLDFTATTETKGTTGNTLTVSFAQRGTQDIQVLKDEVGKECTFPNFDTPLCQTATHAVRLLTSSAAAKERAQLAKAVEAVCSGAKPAEPNCRKAKALQTMAEKLASAGLGVAAPP
jgi:hypothetical protein